MPTTPRIKPQGPDEWSDKAREMFAFFEGPEAYDKGSSHNIMRTFAHHPKLTFAWTKFNGRMLAAPSIEPRLREIVVLRIAHRYDSRYEWAQHVDMGRELGIGPEHLEAIKAGPEHPMWSDFERTALRAADQMNTQAKIDDATWDALAAEFDTKQMLEFMFIVGAYSMLAWIFNSIGVEPEPGAGEKDTQYMARMKPYQPKPAKA